MGKTSTVILVLILIVAFIAGGYYAFDHLREKTFDEKLAQIIHLEDSRQDTAELRAFLDDPDPALRMRAALAIGRIGFPGSGEPLMKLLDNEGIDIAVTAAFALGLTADSQYATALLDRAFDAPARLGAAMVQAAGRLIDSSDATQIDLLGGFLTHPAPEVREAACLALFRAGAKSQSRDLTILLAGEQDEQVQLAAVYALARMGIKDAFDAYTRFYSDADPFMRILCLTGLGQIDDERAMQYLLIGLNDADRHVAVTALRQLGRKKSPQAMARTVQFLETHDDPSFVTEAIRALKRQENAQGVEPVRQLLIAGPDDNVVAEAISYLVTIERDRMVALMDSLVSLNRPVLTAACADGYGQINNPTVIPRLAVLFSDSSATVRSAALSNLARIDSVGVDFYIRRALEDPDLTLRVQAVNLVKDRRLHTYLPGFLELLKGADSTPVDIRRALVDCSSAFIKEEATDSTARLILVQGLLDPDYTVRRDAAAVYESVLGENRWSRVPPSDTRFGISDIEQALKRFPNNPGAVIVTNRGEINVELLFDVAPLTVMNFVDLAEAHFYSGLVFHRVIPAFVAQGGDPRGDGWGGPDWTVRDEWSPETFSRGAVGMASSGKDTGGSQFFITVSPQPHLDGRYTVFGRVISGMDAADDIVQGDTIRDIIIRENIAL